MEFVVSFFVIVAFTYIILNENGTKNEEELQ